MKGENMSYKINNFKKSLQAIVDMLWQYRKAISIYYKKEKENILSRLISFCKAHFKYGINPLLYSYYQLDSVPESMWGEYIVDQDEFNQLLAGDSSVDERRLAGNKIQFYRHCIVEDLPVIPIYCVVTNDSEINIENVKTVGSLEEWQEIFSTLPDEFFIKPILGASGNNSFAVYKEDNSVKFSGRFGSLVDLFDYLKERLHKRGQGFIVQPRMKTHSSLKGVVADKGLSTVRVATLRRFDRSEVIMACLKMIRGNNDHDNFSKGMSNNLISPINTEAGELTPAWGSLMGDWPEMVQYDEHPDSGVKIDGYVLPFWREICELALKAQDSLPSLQTIGWDIALTDDGIFLVEANTAYDAASFQLFEKRGMKSEFKQWFC